MALTSVFLEDEISSNAAICQLVQTELNLRDLLQFNNGPASCPSTLEGQVMRCVLAIFLSGPQYPCLPPLSFPSPFPPSAVSQLIPLPNPFPPHPHIRVQPCPSPLLNQDLLALALSSSHPNISPLDTHSSLCVRFLLLPCLARHKRNVSPLMGWAGQSCSRAALN